jgi:hypothetical protein
MDEEWRSLAACADVGWNYHRWFVGEDDHLRVQEQQERACMVCYICPVQQECLRECAELGVDLMVWGGLTPSQRKRYLEPALRTMPVREAVRQAIAEVGKRTGRKASLALLEHGLDPPPPGATPSRETVFALLTNSVFAA